MIKVPYRMYGTIQLRVNDQKCSGHDPVQDRLRPCRGRAQSAERLRQTRDTGGHRHGRPLVLQGSDGGAERLGGRMDNAVPQRYTSRNLADFEVGKRSCVFFVRSGWSGDAGDFWRFGPPPPPDKRFAAIAGCGPEAVSGCSKRPVFGQLPVRLTWTNTHQVCRLWILYLGCWVATNPHRAMDGGKARDGGANTAVASLHIKHPCTVMRPCDGSSMLQYVLQC